MCITATLSVSVKTGRLQLWKVIKSNNCIGIWGETIRANDDKFQLGINTACEFYNMNSHSRQPAQFHCFFTRAAARQYRRYQKEISYCFPSRKIIKVYANSKDVVLVGVDKESRIPAISVSKIEIKSLNHQR